jgi:hypothetical protein
MVRKIEILFNQISKQEQQEQSDIHMPTTTTTTTTISRRALFQKSTRKNQEFERFLCEGKEAAVLDATTSKYIPLSYFVGVSASQRRSHGLADKMPFESFRLINLQQKGSHAHSLVLFKSRAITTNPEHIAIFECNGQVSQSEIRILHTSLPPKEYLEDTDNEETDNEDTDNEETDNEDTDNEETDNEDTDNEETDNEDTDNEDTDNEDTDNEDTDNDNEEDSDEPGTVYDVSELYFSPVSPRLCMNFGSNTHNPGYCGIFGIMAMVFYRQHQRKQPSTWISEWTKLLTYMREYIPNAPKCHGSMGTELAAQVQEIIAAHPSTHTGHQNAEKEIMSLLNEAIKTQT